MQAPLIQLRNTVSNRPRWQRSVLLLLLVTLACTGGLWAWSYSVVYELYAFHPSEDSVLRHRLNLSTIEFSVWPAHVGCLVLSTRLESYLVLYPHCGYLVGGEVLAVLLLLRMRTRGAALNMCRYCGYDLTGNASGVCPECGKVIPEDQASAVAPER